MSGNALDLVRERSIIVCCGTGGVGKTTVSAVLAVEAARQGRNAVVVTIDPAKRLANTLGLDTLSNTANEIDRRWWDPDGTASAGGRLSALMLDTKSTFDGLIAKYSAEPEQAERIVENRFYRSISSALSGTQEYMAMEKLYELHDEAGYELIVVDTPPTRHALDFLDAPRRLTRLLDNRIFRLLMMPTRTYLRVAGRAVQAFLRTVSKVVGAEPINDVVAFFRAFEGMEEGFRDRAIRVLELLAGGSAAFVLVTSPRRDAVDEAAFFAAKLAESEMPVDALVVNRVHPRFGEERPEGLRARAGTLASVNSDPDRRGAAERLAALYSNLADFQEISERERRLFEGMRSQVKDAAVTYVPFLSRDVHDFEALSEVGEHLFAAEEVEARAAG
ncbi:MAG TPA: ArsA-related P-loop ATPase [Acidimicrobiia bacterium]|nr:ArsA-related P-loop ATPase [Acidimicrobiia bacterium]